MSNLTLALGRPTLIDRIFSRTLLLDAVLVAAGAALTALAAQLVVPLWPVPDVRSRDALPGAVELQLQAAAGEWPPLVVRMAALAPTDPAGSRFTIGGRR